MSNFNDFFTDFYSETMPMLGISNDNVMGFQSLPLPITTDLHSNTELDEAMFLELVDWVKEYGLDLRILDDSALESLELRGEFDHLPEAVITFSRLFDLKVVSDHLVKIPEQFGQLVQMNHLELLTFELSELPASFVNIAGLESLKVDSKRLKCLPANFYRLFNLENLTLWCPALVELPEDFGKLYSLKRLDIVSKKLTRLPASIADFRSLDYFSLAVVRLENIEKLFSSLCQVTDFELSVNEMTAIPENI